MSACLASYFQPSGLHIVVFLWRITFSTVANCCKPHYALLLHTDRYAQTQIVVSRFICIGRSVQLRHKKGRD